MGEPTRTLKALVNLRRESFKFVKVLEECDDGAIGGEIEDEDDAIEKPAKSSCKLNIEFTIDCDCRCSITIHYFCTEEKTANGVV